MRCVDERLDARTLPPWGKEEAECERNERNVHERRAPVKTVRIAATISGLLVLVTLALGQTTAPTPVPNRDAAAVEELTGLISDAICKGMHFRKAVTPFSCTLKCVHDGADYALIVGDTVYILEGHRLELDKVAGGRATIRGQVSGNRIVVDSVMKAEKKAKDGNRADG